MERKSGLTIYFNVLYSTLKVAVSTRRVGDLGGVTEAEDPLLASVSLHGPGASIVRAI